MGQIIYVLSAYIAYEVDEIIGVFSSREKAEEYRDCPNIQNWYSHYEGFEIDEYTLDKNN